ncbi:hypothetical protein BCEP27_20697 [Burkholderia cepacia]
MLFVLIGSPVCEHKVREGAIERNFRIHNDWPFSRALSGRFGSITALDEETSKQSQT